jgi:signal transduction histidine kinase
VLDVQQRGVAYFDERRMARAIQNLVRNAIEAMQQGGTLTLTCADDGEDLMLQVADTGPGIPQAIRGRVFEPFVSVGKKTGTGLGLANVKKIVEEHGGSVEVESTNRGATFTLRIPSAMRPHSLRPHVLAARKTALEAKP